MKNKNKNAAKAAKLAKGKTAKVVLRGATYAQAESGMAEAELYNVRKLDCVYADSTIKAGTVVIGKYGFCVAVRDVKGVKAERTAKFKANCIVRWGAGNKGKGEDFRALANLTDAKAGYVVCQEKGGKLFNMQLTRGGETKTERKQVKVSLVKAL